MKQENKEKSSTVYIGKGIIISAIVITASLGFILGFFVGKSFRPINSEISVNVSNIPSGQHIETVSQSPINQQDNTPSQPNETVNTNTLTALNQQIQSSQTLQQDKGKINTKEETPAQANKNEQHEKSKTNHPTEPELNKNSKFKKYTVQVEAFKNQDAAEELKDKLNNKGYKAVVVPSDKRKNSKLYKVLVGEFATRKEAEIMSIKIRKFEKLQHAFVTFKN